jgi:hypothetical protein
MNKESFIKSTFLKLTSKTYPYGYEDDFVKEMQDINVLPKNLEKDTQGNYLLKIGDSRTIFASHFDTACKSQTPVKHVIDGNIIKTDNTSILGADDKAGVTIMLWMIKNNVPGTYYFFIGEEVGCIGSGLAAKFLEFKGIYDRIISFDRRGTTSIITHQSGTRTCSDEFGKELARQLNNHKIGLEYKIDNTGVYTDSAEFTSVIPECTNVSVGYYQEHTTTEHQDIKHLEKLANACLFVDWESLPTKRDMNKIESKWDSFDSRTNTSWNSRGYSTKRYSGSTTKSWNNSNYSQYDYGQYGSYHDEDYSDYYGSRYNKKTRRGGKKNWQTEEFSGREFFDNGAELVEIKSNTNFISEKNYKYEPMKDKFFNTSLSKEEVEIIKEQYLDMNNPNDRDCYEVMINALVY